MKLDKMGSSWEAMKSNNKMFLYLSLIMATANFLLVTALVNQDHTIVLVPNNLNEKVEVATNHASQGYKKAWATYAATLLGNVTPENADFVLESLNTMVTADIKVQLAESVRRDTQALRDEHVISTFEIRKVGYEPETENVFVTGKHWITGAGAKSGSTTQTFEFKISIRDYVPAITNIALYEGEPRTIDVVKRQSQNQTQTKTGE